ncbi:MAG: YfiT family bacillithiol transferase [Terriglobales bacterium]
MTSTEPAVDPKRYPIGRFQPPAAFGPAEREAAIGQIERLPEQLRPALSGLSAAQLNTPYRDGGWTAQQVVHHLFDSHSMAHARFRLALTEDEPAIFAYKESAWAELADARSAPAQISLVLLDGLHRRWAWLLRALEPQQFQRAFRHPERGRMTLDENLALYAWHGRHHTGHILGLRQRQGW